jgi:hypothetical protein
MNCPREGCNGLVEGPEWEHTHEGKVYQVRCLNCGWRSSDPLLCVYNTENFVEKEIRTLEEKYIRPKLPFSAYDFGEARSSASELRGEEKKEDNIAGSSEGLV